MAARALWVMILVAIVSLSVMYSEAGRREYSDALDRIAQRFGMVSGQCADETARLTAIAKSVQVTVTSPPHDQADEPVHVTWRSGQRGPLRVPMFIAVAIPGEVRFELAPLPPRPSSHEPPYPDLVPELPGFLAFDSRDPRPSWATVWPRRHAGAHTATPTEREADGLLRCEGLKCG